VRFCVQRARKARKEREKKTGDGAPTTQNNESQTARKTFFPPLFSLALAPSRATLYPRRLSLLTRVASPRASLISALTFKLTSLASPLQARTEKRVNQGLRLPKRDGRLD